MIWLMMLLCVVLLVWWWRSRRWKDIKLHRGRRPWE